MGDNDERLERWIGYRLKQAQSALHGRMDGALGEIGLSVSQYATLELIRRSPGATNAQLAREAFVTRQSMNTMLHGLQNRGFIDRTSARAGGREMPTRLTADGGSVLGEAAVLVAEIEAEMLGGLTASQQTALLDGLSAMIVALQQPGQ